MWSWQVLKLSAEEDSQHHGHIGTEPRKADLDLTLLSPFRCPQGFHRQTQLEAESLVAHWCSLHRAASWGTKQGQVGRKDLGGQMKISSTFSCTGATGISHDGYVCSTIARTPQMPVNPKTTASRSWKGTSRACNMFNHWEGKGKPGLHKDTEVRLRTVPGVFAQAPWPYSMVHSRLESRCCSHFTFFLLKRKSHTPWYAHFTWHICLVTYLEREAPLFWSSLSLALRICSIKNRWALEARQDDTCLLKVQCLRKICRISCPHSGGAERWADIWKPDDRGYGGSRKMLFCNLWMVGVW